MVKYQKQLLNTKRGQLRNRSCWSNVNQEHNILCQKEGPKLAQMAFYKKLKAPN